MVPRFSTRAAAKLQNCSQVTNYTIRYVWLCAVCKSMQVLAEFEKLIFDKLCGSGVGGGRGDLDARLGNDGSRLHTICTEI